MLLTPEQSDERRTWIANWRHIVGDQLLGGYATLHHARRLTTEENTTP